MKVYDIKKEQLEFLWEHDPEWVFDNRPWWAISQRTDWVLENGKEWLGDHRQELLDGPSMEVPERIVSILEEMEKKKDENN